VFALREEIHRVTRPNAIFSEAYPKIFLDEMCDFDGDDFQELLEEHPEDAAMWEEARRNGMQDDYTAGDDDDDDDEEDEDEDEDEDDEGDADDEDENDEDGDDEDEDEDE
jgi:hypothetical protein